jgi:hypothetical protein
VGSTYSASLSSGDQRRRWVDPPGEIYDLRAREQQTNDEGEW